MRLAHEKWFTDEVYAPDWGFVLQPRTLAYLGVAVLIATLWRWADHYLPRPEVAALAPLGWLVPWIPRLLAVHAGVSLLAQAARGSYLAPGMELPPGAAGLLLAVVEGIAGVWLVSGFRIRPAAWFVVVSGPLGMLFYGPVAVLERADLLGVALFLALLPPGQDDYGAVVPSAEQVRRALWSLRVAAGVALVVLAFTEKLLSPETSLEFLDRYPAFNVLEAVGVGDLEFVRIAGAIEVLIGLLLVSGAAPQVAVLAAAVPFNATLFFLGAEELIGHLPVYGVMLTLLVYGSHQRYAPEVRRISPG